MYITQLTIRIVYMSIASTTFLLLRIMLLLMMMMIWKSQQCGRTLVNACDAFSKTQFHSTPSRCNMTVTHSTIDIIDSHELPEVTFYSPGTKLIGLYVKTLVSKLYIYIYASIYISLLDFLILFIRLSILFRQLFLKSFYIDER